jgi:hypothetical protein
MCKIIRFFFEKKLLLSRKVLFLQHDNKLINEIKGKSMYYIDVNSL